MSPLRSLRLCESKHLKHIYMIEHSRSNENYTFMKCDTDSD